MRRLGSEICENYIQLAENIAAFRDSLYEQKHAFYFRRVSVWHEHYDVGGCIT